MKEKKNSKSNESKVEKNVNLGIGKPKQKELTVDIKATKSNKGLRKLLNFFKVLPVNNQYVVPSKNPRDENGKTMGELKPIDTMKNSIQQAYEYIVGNRNQGVYRANEYRFLRYKDLKYAEADSSILNLACQVYVSEAYSPKQDDNDGVKIVAKDDKVEKLFYSWLDDIGMDENKIRATLFNICLYGDGFWTNEIDLNSTKSGITGVSLLDPFLVANRIEFNVNETYEQSQWGTAFLNMVNTNSALKDIYDQLMNNDNQIVDFSNFYKSYCLGYELKLTPKDEDNGRTVGVAPWYVTHCRLFTTETDFFPFGKSIFMNSIAQFKSYRTTQMLSDMLRVATFPRQIINIKGSENMDIYSRLERVDEVKQFLENITSGTNTQDGLAVGENIYAMEDLFSVDEWSPDSDLDKLGDLEIKQSEMVMSTGIPDSYLLPSKGAGDLGGENAESLYYLNKIFQRRVDCIRDAFLEGLEETFRIHLMLTEQFDGAKTEFELSLPTDIDEYNEDKISKDSDMLDFATNILNNLGEMVGLERGDTLPKEVVKDVLKMYLPIDDDKINKWIKILVKEKEELDKEKEKMGIESTDGGNAPLIQPTGNVIGHREKGSESGTSSSTDTTTSSGSEEVTTSVKVESKKLNEQKLIEKIKENNLVHKSYLETKHSLGKSNGKTYGRYCVNNTYRLKNNLKNNSRIYLLSEQLQKNKLKKLEESKIGQH